jgi:hypothetical protein
MAQTEHVEVKKEKGDDVLAGIIGDGTYEVEDDTNTNPTYNALRIASPVSPVPLPSTTVSPGPPPSGNSNAIPLELNVEPVSPQKDASAAKENQKEKPTSITKEKTKTEAADDKHTPRMLKLSGDGHADKFDHDMGGSYEPSYHTITEFRKRPDARRATRFFVMKSFSENHLKISAEKGIWATQRINEGKLNDAFRKCDVVLVFSVNESRHFQGYAQMTSPIGGYKTANVWVDSRHDNVWGNSFHVKWLQLYDLPFTETAHLRNPYNDDKPVKVCRDGTELAEETAMALCTLIDNGAAKAERKRKPSGSEENKSSNGNDHAKEASPESKRVRGEDLRKEDLRKEDLRKEDLRKEDLRKEGLRKEDLHKEDVHRPLQSRRIVLPPNSRAPLYDMRDYTKPPPALHSHGYPPQRTTFNDRYVPRSADSSPPAKRARSNSPPPRSIDVDRKRKDREDEEERGRGRDFDRDRAWERDRGRDRDFRDRDFRDRDFRDSAVRDRHRELENEDRNRRDHRDNNKRSSGNYSPPPDLLNMSYEDYLQTLAKYRRMPQPPWGLIGGGNPLSESEYVRYLGILAKQMQSARDLPAYPL